MRCFWWWSKREEGDIKVGLKKVLYVEGVGEVIVVRGCRGEGLGSEDSKVDLYFIILFRFGGYGVVEHLFGDGCFLERGWDRGESVEAFESFGGVLIGIVARFLTAFFPEMSYGGSGIVGCESASCCFSETIRGYPAFSVGLLFDVVGRERITFSDGSVGFACFGKSADGSPVFDTDLHNSVGSGEGFGSGSVFAEGL